MAPIEKLGIDLTFIVSEAKVSDISVDKSVTKILDSVVKYLNDRRKLENSTLNP